MNLASIRRIKDPKKRAERATAFLKERQAKWIAEIDAIRDVRDDAGRAMLSLKVDGKYVYRPADLARAMGITRASVAERFPHAKDRK